MVTKKVKSVFQRVMLTSMALMSALPVVALSPGAAAGLGVAGGVVGGIALYEIIKHNERKEDRSYNNKKSMDGSRTYKSSKVSPTISKKDVKSDLKQARKDLRNHKRKLNKLKKDGKAATPEAIKHKSDIERIEQVVHDLEHKLDTVFN